MSDYREALEFQKRILEQKIKEQKLGNGNPMRLAELYSDLREVNLVLRPAQDDGKVFGFW